MESLQRILNNATVTTLIVELCDLRTLCKLLQACRVKSENLQIAFSARALTSRSSQARAAAVVEFKKLKTGCEYAIVLVSKHLTSRGYLVRLAAVKALIHLAQKNVEGATELLTKQLLHENNAAVKVTAVMGLSGSFNDIRTVVVTALKMDGHALEHVSHEMKGDRELCVAAVAQNWEALKWVREDMKGDKDILLAAFQQRGLSFSRHDINNSRSVVKAAVQQRGIELKITSNEMKDDRELCTAAVAQNGLALEFVSHKLKGDRALCMAAIGQNGLALQFGSQEIKGDRELCIAAVAQNGFAVNFVSEKLTDDDSFLKALGAIKLPYHSHALYCLYVMPHLKSMNEYPFWNSSSPRGK